jgi:hypothetical protein
MIDEFLSLSSDGQCLKESQLRHHSFILMKSKERRMFKEGEIHLSTIIYFYVKEMKCLLRFIEVFLGSCSCFIEFSSQ